MVLLAIVPSIVLGLVAWLVLRDREPSNWPAEFRGVIRDVKHERLVGRTREQIIAKYGPTRATGYFQEWDMVYPIRPERGMISIDSEWLVLRLKEDAVVEARLVRD